MMADDLNVGDNGDYMTSRNLKTNDKQGFKFTPALLGFHLKEFARLTLFQKSTSQITEKRLALYQINHPNHFNPPRPLGTILIKTLPHLKKHSILISHFSVMDFALGIDILSVDLICGNLKLP